MSSSRILSSKTLLAPAYAKLFNHECFEPIIDKLPSKFEHFSPYELSQYINEMLDNTSVKKDQISLIHNRLIEELSQYEYGISTVHAKKLKQIGGKLSKKSVVEIIKNNPGRVHDSWELLMQYPKSWWTDDLLLAALENTVSTKTLKENGERHLPLKYLAECVLLLARFKNKDIVDPDMLDFLVEAILEQRATEVLPVMLNFGMPSLKPFSERLNDLTLFQTYQLYKSYPLNLLATNEKLFLKVVYTLGTNSNINMCQEELDASQKMQGYISTLSQESGICDVLVLDGKTHLEKLQEDYVHVREYIEEKRIDRCNFTLAKTLLRVEGVYKGDSSKALELYHSYLLSYQNRADELMFEIFLCLAAQSYKSSNPALLKYAQAFISADYTEENVTNTVRVLILAHSKFDVDKSLEIYNENIGTFIKRNDDTFSSGLITESLILAYLANNDLDFARVVFNGALREKVLSRVNSIKNVKSLFKLYGDAMEESKTLEVMNEEVSKAFKTL